MASLIPLAIEHSGWKVREGNVGFWFDNWAGFGALAHEV